MNTAINSNSITEVSSAVTPDNPAQDTAQAAQPAASNAAAHNMFVGGLWCVGGILVTALTYNAVKESGGHYIIAWGAILFGGLQFLKGLIQLGE